MIYGQPHYLRQAGPSTYTISRMVCVVLVMAAVSGAASARRASATARQRRWAQVASARASCAATWPGWVGTDLLGSVRLATDPSGNTIGAGAYDAWGTARANTGANGATCWPDCRAACPSATSGSTSIAAPVATARVVSGTYVSTVFITYVAHGSVTFMVEGC